MSATLRTAIFFDRDGVVNRSPGQGYLLHKDSFEFNPGIFEALQVCKTRGWLTVVITNQQGVAKGLMTQQDLDAIHRHMQAQLADQGLAFDGIYAAIDPPGPNSRRKPSPAMLYEAAQDLAIDLQRSCMIGDHDRDIETARNAGLPIAIRIVGSDHAPGCAAEFTLLDTADLANCLRSLPW